MMGYTNFTGRKIIGDPASLSRNNILLLYIYTILQNRPKRGKQHGEGQLWQGVMGKEALNSN